MKFRVIIRDNLYNDIAETGLYSITNQQTQSQTRSVGNPCTVISATKMNVMYVGVDNPLSISVSGVHSSKISVQISQGSLVKQQGGSANEYLANPTTSGTATVTVFAEINGQRKNMGSMNFRVMMLPIPEAQIAKMNGGYIEKNVLISQQGIAAEMGRDFLFDLRYIVNQFAMVVQTAQGDLTFFSNGFGFTAEQRAAMQGLTKGQRVFFTNIKARGPVGVVDLKDIFFTIN